MLYLHGVRATKAIMFPRVCNHEEILLHTLTNPVAYRQ